MRTVTPSALMSCAVRARHTRVASWPASASFTPMSEPYEAPNTRTLRAFIAISRFQLPGGPHHITRVARAGIGIAARRPSPIAKAACLGRPRALLGDDRPALAAEGWLREPKQRDQRDE